MISKVISLILLIAIGMPIGFSTIAFSGVGDEDYDQVHICFEPWLTSARHRGTIEDLKKKCPMEIILRQHESKIRFQRLLRIGEMKPRSVGTDMPEVKLIIEFYKNGKATETYYASSAALYSKNFQMFREIDETLTLAPELEQKNPRG